MNRAALIAIIFITALISLWMLLAWLGRKSDLGNRTPSQSIKFENNVPQSSPFNNSLCCVYGGNFSISTLHCANWLNVTGTEQPVFRSHVHLMPRRKGDVENPRGGERHIIDGKGEY